MDDNGIRQALSLLERRAQQPEGMADALFARLLLEIEEPQDVEVVPRRRGFRLPGLVPIGVAAALVALVATVITILPGQPSAWATLERAREQFRRRPVHAIISNGTQVFDADLKTVMEIEVVEHWFESESRWRSTTKSQNLFPHLAGNFTVTDGERFGEYSAEENTFVVQPAAAVDDRYLQSGLAIHDPTIGAWGTSTGIKPTQQFLDENCTVGEDRIAGRAADRLECDTGLEGDTLREATIWLDRETGFILKLVTFSCGKVEGERRCGNESIREVTSIEFDPSFPDGIFDVTPPRGATVRGVVSELARGPSATIDVDVDPSRIRAGLGAVWVGGAAGRGAPGRLLRIDLATSAAVTVVDDARLFDVGEGFVWVVSQADGAASLRRLDPRTNRFAGAPLELGRIDAQDVAVGEGAVWVTGFTRHEPPERGELLRVDPVTNQVRRTALDGAPSRVSLGAGAAWVTVWFPPADASAPPRDRIHKVDARTGSVEATLSPSGRVVAAFGEGALWTLSPGGRAATLTKIEPASMREVATLELPPDRSAALFTIGAGRVWVLNYDAGTLTRIDPIAIRVLGEPIRYGRSGGQAFAIGEEARTAWVGMYASVGRGTVLRLDIR